MIFLKKNNPFIKALISLSLIIVFIIPIGVELSKSIRGHKHESCSETLSHFHQEFDYCSFCNFNFFVFDFNLNATTPYTIYHVFSERGIPLYINSFSFFHNKTYFSRGPPHNS